MWERVAARALWRHIHHRECCYASYAWHCSSAGLVHGNNSKHRRTTLFFAACLLQQPVEGAASKRSCADKMLNGAVQAWFTGLHIDVHNPLGCLGAARCWHTHRPTACQSRPQRLANTLTYLSFRASSVRETVANFPATCVAGAACLAVRLQLSWGHAVMASSPQPKVHYKQLLISGSSLICMPCLHAVRAALPA